MTTASEINTALEALFDRTACLVPDVQTFTANGTWAKPAHAQWIKFVLVNAGQDGADGSTGCGGGGGGASGTMIEATLPASQVPSTLAVNVPLASSGANFAKVSSATTPAFVIEAWQNPVAPANGSGGSGGAGGTCPGKSPVTNAAWSVCGAAGGVGGDGNVPNGSVGANGAPGATSGSGIGGAGGVTGGSAALGGGPGRGYGAGGGGGAGANGGGAGGGGGGGGGGGWGNALLATAGADGTVRTGGQGAPGIIIITTWRGEPIT